MNTSSQFIIGAISRPVKEASGNVFFYVSNIPCNLLKVELTYPNRRPTFYNDRSFES